MNTEEAIEFLEIEYGNINPDYPLSAKTWKEKKKRYDEIINLLKRGEKYEEMWEECKKDISRASVENWEVYTERFILEMKKLEQKYFPKGD